MRPGRGRWVVAAALAVTTCGCGLGPGASSSGEATLTVTRDYGAERLLEARAEDPAESETVIRLLDREAEIETRYGGGFVQSIEGVSGGLRDGRSFDWFFFVNGVESPIGAAEAEVRGGDRIWWDYRDWTAAMRTPAVVGSWPEPFAQASADAERLPVLIDCQGVRDDCDAVSERLAEEGVDASIERTGADAVTAPRLLVGPWARLRDDPIATLLDGGPERSGVFARFLSTGGGYELVALDEAADPAERLAKGAGLVAALRAGTDPPTWLVTGTDRAGVEAAVAILDEGDLADRYAAAADEDGEPLGLPVSAEGS